jgi:hypothetical protein
MKPSGMTPEANQDDPNSAGVIPITMPAATERAFREVAFTWHLPTGVLLRRRLPVNRAWKMRREYTSSCWSSCAVPHKRCKLTQTRHLALCRPKHLSPDHPGPYSGGSGWRDGPTRTIWRRPFRRCASSWGVGPRHREGNSRLDLFGPPVSVAWPQISPPAVSTQATRPLPNPQPSQPSSAISDGRVRHTWPLRST